MSAPGNERQDARVGSIWSCKIGEAQPTIDGADLPMREAVRNAYRSVTGLEPVFIFSGWGAELTEDERAVADEVSR